MFLRLTTSLLIALGLLLPSGAATVAAAADGDSPALAGVVVARGLFDVSRGDARGLAAALELVTLTRETIRATGATPDLQVVLRGPAVARLAAAPGKGEPSPAAGLRELVEAGIRVSVCRLALSRFGVDPDDLPPGLEPVANGLVTLIALQNKGYALVPLY